MKTDVYLNNVDQFDIDKLKGGVFVFIIYCYSLLGSFW